MRILYSGDIFGRPGRQVVKELVPAIVAAKGIDIVFANVENISGGAGIDRKRLDEVLASGVAACTAGNHTWHNKEILEWIDAESRLARPANLPEPCPGNDHVIVAGPGGVRIALVNLLGRLFMEPVDCPFRKADAMLEKLAGKADIILVDFHAEATSEKMALGYYLDGRVTAVLGTHTHVQTADERVLKGGTAFITDMGMSGPHESIIGVSIAEVTTRFLTARPIRYSPSQEGLMFNGVIIDVNESDWRALSIERVRMPLEKTE